MVNKKGLPCGLLFSKVGYLMLTCYILCTFLLVPGSSTPFASSMRGGLGVTRLLVYNIEHIIEVIDDLLRIIVMRSCRCDAPHSTDGVQNVG